MLPAITKAVYAVEDKVEELMFSRNLFIKGIFFELVLNLKRAT